MTKLFTNLLYNSIASKYGETVDLINNSNFLNGDAPNEASFNPYKKYITPDAQPSPIELPHFMAPELEHALVALNNPSIIQRMIDDKVSFNIKTLGAILSIVVFDEKVEVQINENEIIANATNPIFESMMWMHMITRAAAEQGIFSDDRTIH